jgi:hypothetical protein
MNRFSFSSCIIIQEVETAESMKKLQMEPGRPGNSLTQRTSASKQPERDGWILGHDSAEQCWVI